MAYPTGTESFARQNMSNAAKLGFLPGKLVRGAVMLMRASLISNLAFLPDEPARGGSPVGPRHRIHGTKSTSSKNPNFTQNCYLSRPPSRTQERRVIRPTAFIPHRTPFVKRQYPVSSSATALQTSAGSFADRTTSAIRQAATERPARTYRTCPAAIHTALRDRRL